MEKKEIELMGVRSMIYIPEHTLELTIDAKVWKDGKVIHVSKMLGMDEVQKAVQDAERNYIEDDDRFVLTEKGKQYLDDLENGFKITC